MKKVLESIKGFFQKLKDTVSDKIKIDDKYVKYIKYVVALLLLVILVLVLYNCTGPEKRKVEEETESQAEPTAVDFVLDEKFEQDAHEDVNALITSYFNAYANGNVDELATIASPISDNEKSYIGVCSNYMESYQNISCYTKSGLTEGSYLVSAYYELKFYGVDTLAPGVEFFYLDTDENGNLYINNLYSAYNRERMEDEMDSNIYAIYVMYGQQEDVQLLREDVQQKYQEALSSDANLVTMLSTTFPEAIESWKNTILAIEQSEENGTEDVTDTENATENQDAQTPTDGNATEGDNAAEGENAPESDDATGGDNVTGDDGAQEEAVITVKITAKSLNVREKADVNSTSLGKVSKGDTFTKLGVSGDWTQIDYNGTPAYVKTEYVQEVANE